MSHREVGKRAFLAAFIAWGAWSGCSDTTAPPGGASSGSAMSGANGSGSTGAGSTGASGGAASGGATSSGSKASPVSGSSSGGPVSGVAPGTPDGSTGAGQPDAGSSDGAPPYDGSGLAVIDAAGRTQPTCVTPVPSPNAKGSLECDFLGQSIDFELDAGYPSPPGAIKITDFGLALGLWQINTCHPYCYGQNFTIGVDIVGGGDPKQQNGEVIFEFPAAGKGLPIATGVGRDSLAWIWLEGPAKPTFTINAQMVVETMTGTVASVPVKPVPFGPNKWTEFKYFGITDNTFAAPLRNVTGIGFRITSTAAAGQEWHGVAYIDHLQMRSGAAGQ